MKNLDFTGDGKVKVSVDDIVKSERWQENVHAVRSIADMASAKPYPLISGNDGYTMKNLEGYKSIFCPVDGESIVGLVQFKGALIIATTKGVYRAESPDGPVEKVTLKVVP